MSYKWSLVLLVVDGEGLDDNCSHLMWKTSLQSNDPRLFSGMEMRERWHSIERRASKVRSIKAGSNSGSVPMLVYMLGQLRLYSKYELKCELS